MEGWGPLVPYDVEVRVVRGTVHRQASTLPCQYNQGQLFRIPDGVLRLGGSQTWIPVPGVETLGLKLNSLRS